MQPPRADGLGGPERTGPWFLRAGAQWVLWRLTKQPPGFTNAVAPLLS